MFRGNFIPRVFVPPDKCLGNNTELLVQCVFPADKHVTQSSRWCCFSAHFYWIESVTELSRVARFVKVARWGAKTRGTRLVKNILPPEKLRGAKFLRLAVAVSSSEVTWICRSIIIYPHNQLLRTGSTLKSVLHIFNHDFFPLDLSFRDFIQLTFSTGGNWLSQTGKIISLIFEFNLLFVPFLLWLFSNSC